MIVIAVIAAISSVVAWATYGILGATHNASDLQNANAWNSVYSNVIAVDPNFASLDDWDVVSRKLADGVPVTASGSTMIFKAPLPVFSNENVKDTFVKGTGLTYQP